MCGPLLQCMGVGCAPSATTRNQPAWQLKPCNPPPPPRSCPSPTRSRPPSGPRYWARNSPCWPAAVWRWRQAGGLHVRPRGHRHAARCDAAAAVGDVAVQPPGRVPHLQQARGVGGGGAGGGAAAGRGRRRGRRGQRDIQLRRGRQGVRGVCRVYGVGRYGVFGSVAATGGGGQWMSVFLWEVGKRRWRGGQ